MENNFMYNLEKFGKTLNSNPKFKGGIYGNQ